MHTPCPADAGSSPPVRVIQPHGESIAAAGRPIALLTRFWRQRALLRRFAWRNVTMRYRGSFLGLLWSFITPLVMLAVYTFIFSVVFSLRTGVERSRYDFAIFVFAGLVPFQFVSESWSTAPGLMLQNANYVKRVVFPLEVLPVAQSLAAAVHALIGMALLLVAELAVYGQLSWDLLWAPLCWLPILAIAVGGGLGLSAVGVFVRDVGPLVAIGLSVLFFLTPIVYSLEQVPDKFRWLLNLNPLTPMIGNLRRALLVADDQPPDLTELGVSLLIGVGVFWIGTLTFLKARKAFADVI